MYFKLTKKINFN